MGIIKNFDFVTISNEKLKQLEEAKEMVLSTSLANKVTSRIVSTSCQERQIIFLSWNHHTKCHQIRENSMVALSYDRLQIEGVATIKGNPLSKENNLYAELYKSKQPNYYEVFTKFKGMVMVLVEINFISWFGKNESQYYLDRLDFTKKIAYREKAEID